MDSLQALDAHLKGAESRLNDADEIVVGAVRGLLECARFGDAEALSILSMIRLNVVGRDEALYDAIHLFQEKLEAWQKVSQEVRAAISKQEG